ncbi:MAG: hypothetical protein ACK5IJ_06430 [Mangrovibacterium sp.]
MKSFVFSLMILKKAECRREVFKNRYIFTSIMDEKTKFLLQNLAKGGLYFLALAILYLLADKYIITPNKGVLTAYVYERTPLVYLSYVCSEVFFGLFPPELYMKWSLHRQSGLSYWQDVALFAIISYGAGVLSFYLGRTFRNMRLFRFFSRKLFKDLWPMFRKYGSFLIITAALTPLPWGLVSMLVGTTEYKSNHYLLFALFRLLRFFSFAYLVEHSIDFSLNTWIK